MTIFRILHTLEAHKNTTFFVESIGYKCVTVEYTTVHIPRGLADLIDKLIDRGEFAYSSRSEFVKDAIRRFLEEYGCYPPNSRLRSEESAYLSISSVEQKTKKGKRWRE